jgi:bacillithiol system protein YtxJ
MGWFSSKQKQSVASVPWQNLTEMSQWAEIWGNKNGDKHIVFKHSTRCSISIMAKRKTEQDWEEGFGEVHIWYLDLLNHRDISNAIAEKTGVVHQSPQAISFCNGQVEYHATHGRIDIKKAVKSLDI